MKGLAALIRLIVFSNIFISGCVLCFTAKTALILFGNNGNIHVNLLAFFSTIFLYNFHGLFNFMRSHATGAAENQVSYWNLKHIRIKFSVMVTALLLALSQLMYMPLRVWLVLVPVSLLALGYCIPFIRIGSRLLRLRDILWLKVLWIAFGYAWLTTCLPVAYAMPFNNLLQPQVVFIFLRNFLFVFAIAIPFDIRDMETDLKTGLRTLPLLFGVRGSIFIALFFLLAFLASASLQVYFHTITLPVFFALALSTVTTALVIPLASPRKPALFFPFAIEGSMVLQWALLYAFLYVKL
ncbi:MAG: UbiA family prenyltransferase [Bacteroidia bacterium]|nr:UbiA family prenyltransferase [Bacteroidia bacterium]